MIPTGLKTEIYTDVYIIFYDINSDIYVKKEEIKNNEFIESLKQYDNLIKSSDDSATIINAEKQVLAKYESLVLNSEQIAY